MVPGGPQLSLHFTLLPCLTPQKTAASVYDSDVPILRSLNTSNYEKAVRRRSSPGSGPNWLSAMKPVTSLDPVSSSVEHKGRASQVVFTGSALGP